MRFKSNKLITSRGITPGSKGNAITRENKISTLCTFFISGKSCNARLTKLSLFEHQQHKVKTLIQSNWSHKNNTFVVPSMKIFLGFVALNIRSWKNPLCLKLTIFKFSAKWQRIIVKTGKRENNGKDLKHSAQRKTNERQLFKWNKKSLGFQIFSNEWEWISFVSRWK